MEKGKIKYIYWFAYYGLQSPSVRYRAKYPLDHFREQYGINSCLVIPGYSPRRIGLFIKAWLSALCFRKEKSLIVIQRVSSSFIYATLLKFLVLVRPRNTVYDLDDADYIFRPSATIRFFAKHCSSVSAGSEGIKKYLSQFNKKVQWISSPTPLSFVQKKDRSELFTVGWVGSFAGDHKKSLSELLFPALQQIHAPLRLLMIGVQRGERQYVENKVRDNPDVHLELSDFSEWDNEKALQELILNFDVGIATLSDNEFERSKSGIKAKQYLCCGVPVLCNNLPENNSVVKHGVNGYYCDTHLSFATAVKSIREMDTAEYRRLSRNALESAQVFDYEQYMIALTGLSSR